MALSKDFLVKVYRDMVRTRTLDNQMIRNARSGRMVSGWHSGLGQEAIVGPVALLRQDDYVTYTHRGAYVWVAKGIPVKEIIAEFYGKATGCAGGYGGTHVSKPSLGIFGRSGMQGGHFPLAVGMGIAAQMRGASQAVMMFFGDGCGTRGTLHEAFNFASVWKLPILWVCENNGLSMSVKMEKCWAVDSIARIADSYAMPGLTVDGNDVITVAEAAAGFLDRARSGEGPALLEMMTYRWRGHNEGDPGLYRTREEVEEWMQKDPLRRFELVLLAQGVLAEEAMQGIKAEADAEIAGAQQFTLDSPDPDPSEVTTKVYATSFS